MLVHIGVLPSFTPFGVARFSSGVGHMLSCPGVFLATNEHSTNKQPMQKPNYYWKAEEEAIVREFMEKYPKGDSFNVTQVKYSEPEKLKILTDGGRTVSSIYAKGRYIKGVTSKQKKVQAPRTKEPKGKMPDVVTQFTQTWNYCPNCGHSLSH